MSVRDPCGIPWRWPRGNQIRFSGSQRGVRKIEFQAPCTYSCTYSIYRHTNHVKSNLCGGISNLRGGTSNLRIFDINPATKFEYGGKSNLVAPDLLSSSYTCVSPDGGNGGAVTSLNIF